MQALRAVSEQGWAIQRQMAQLVDAFGRKDQN
jgi:hypothetical protein